MTLFIVYSAGLGKIKEGGLFLFKKKECPQNWLSVVIIA
jgi:hypothetical protein